MGKQRVAAVTRNPHTVTADVRTRPRVATRGWGDR
jgi:hypothetical protein